MAGILRSQFHSDTTNLFTDEKTANARAKVIEWVNELGITTDTQKKCEIIVKVQETIVGSCAELLEEFLDSILSLAHDTNMEVRKQVVSFIEHTSKVKVELLPQFISVVSMLLRDRSPQVIKRVIQACGNIYRNGLQWICTHTKITDSVDQAWNVLNLLKAQILDLIDNENDGIRTNAIKFLEGVVILQSYGDEDSQKKDNDFSLADVPEHLEIVNREKLEEEALNIFDILLKFHAATHISSVNLIACTWSLCSISKLRPCFMSAVVDAFKQLNANLPPTLTDSQVSSVRKSLKMQLIALLKLRGSYEFQAVIRNLLQDLGTSQSEIQRNIPKMDKQEISRRQKRILENATNSILPKRMRFTYQHEDNMETNDRSNEAVGSKLREMEVDEDELEKQRHKSTRVNEKFLAENLRSTEVAVNLVMEFLPQMPDEATQHFLQNYSPVSDLALPQLISRISRKLGEEMTEKKNGPGAAAFTREPPMRPVAKKSSTTIDEIATNVHADPVGATTVNTINEEQQRKDEATKKLRENIERLKGEQELIERMKQRAKTLKLQEVTKPLARPLKDKFLLDSVTRILQSERQCIAGGVLAKRRKIITIIAATFPDNVRYFIFDSIMQDIRHRIDLAFCWLYEEYCLLQGFTRHSYVKSEHRPDHAYNELISQLISGISSNCEFKDKIVLLRRVFLEAPLLPEPAIEQLLQMCLKDEYSQYSLELIRDLAILRPPRRNKFIRILLAYSVHERKELRERTLALIVTLYHKHKILPNRIDEFALEWLSFLEREIPPEKMFTKEAGRPEIETAWKEETAKICLNLALELLPYNPKVYLEKLAKVYTDTSADLKRTILRNIDSAIKNLGPENAILLKLIEECPKGIETLIIRFIYILTDRQSTPNVQLVQHVRDLYAHKVKEVRLLIPILAGLTRNELLGALPNLIKLNQVVVREVFNRLLCIGPEFAEHKISASPADILVALHNIDVNMCDLRCVVKATSLCMSEKDVYTQEVLTLVLNQLVDMLPLPTLLMRTIIQSLTLYPKLANFVLQLLQRLIMKQVWRNKVIWEGFLKCCQRLKPQSMPILLQLPLAQLQAALQQCPDMRSGLVEYAKSIKEEPMTSITTQVLDVITGKEVDVFVTDETGGYINVDNIKKEIEEPTDGSTLTKCPTNETVPTAANKTISNSGANQPLPPGEE